MKTIPAILDRLGGPAAVADALKMPYTTVSSWKARGSVPGRQWAALVELARRRRLRGLTLEHLARLHIPHTVGKTERRAA